MNKITKLEKNNLILSVIVLFCLFSAIFYFVYSGWVTLRDDGYSSCLASISNEVDKNKATFPLENNNK